MYVCVLCGMGPDVTVTSCFAVRVGCARFCVVCVVRFVRPAYMCMYAAVGGLRKKDGWHGGEWGSFVRVFFLVADEYVCNMWVGCLAVSLVLYNLFIGAFALWLF